MRRLIPALVIGLIFGVLATPDGVSLSYSDIYTQWHAAGTLLDEGRMMARCITPTTPQDVYYVSLIGKCGDPMTAWPPLYTLAIASVRAVTTDEGQALALLRAYHVMTWGGVAVVVYALLRRATTHRRAVLVTVLMLSNPPVVSVAQLAASEPQFFLLSLAFLYLLVTYKPNTRHVLLLGCAAMLACMQRYTGVLCVGMGAVYLGYRREYRRSLLFSLLAFAPLLYWCLRNVLFVGQPFGYRPPSPHTQDALLSATIASILQVLPYMLTVFLAGAAFARRVASCNVFPHVLFAVLYGIGMFVSAHAGEFTLLNVRLYSPAFIPLMFGSFHAGAWLIQRLLHIRPMAVAADKLVLANTIQLDAVPVQ